MCIVAKCIFANCIFANCISANRILAKCIIAKCIFAKCICMCEVSENISRKYLQIQPWTWARSWNRCKNPIHSACRPNNGLHSGNKLLLCCFAHFFHTIARFCALFHTFARLWTFLYTFHTFVLFCKYSSVAHWAEHCFSAVDGWSWRLSTDTASRHGLTLL